ncbi:MAG: class I SAM-dependent methyltransferase [Candidatus Bathyarchaeota archaeon]|nr:class I SAM-dependent methyltransferase [Candidatus Bathyarchaeum sp.]
MSDNTKSDTFKLGNIVFNSLENIAKKTGAVDERNLKYSQYIIKHVKKNSIVLDVGCNVGQFSVECAKNGAQTLSIDFSREMLGYIPKIDGINRLVCDAQNLPIKESAVDTILAISVLEHLRTPELALNEFQRVIKTKGSLIVQIPNPEYFIEVHTKFPLIFLLPDSIKEKINNRTFGHYYTNFKLSKKKFLQIVTPFFSVIEIMPVYHKIKTPLWPPSWIMHLAKRP